MTQIENRITKGNVISTGASLFGVAVVLVGAAMWTGAQGPRIDNAEATMRANSAAIAAHEGRIRAVETTIARQDERLLLILDTVRKIEAKLERAEP